MAYAVCMAAVSISATAGVDAGNLPRMWQYILSGAAWIREDRREENLESHRPSWPA